MNIFFHMKAALRHWLYVVDSHSVHSPYFFDFYNNVLHAVTPEDEFGKFEKLRTDLLSNPTLLSITDPGAGSVVLHPTKRSLADIARISITPRELAELYTRIIRHIDAQRIVELGSCLGVTTLYMAQKKNSVVYTFESSPELINVSLTNYEYFDQRNIQLIEGNIDQTLPDFLQDPAKISFVLMDANHRYAPTIKYFNMLSRRLTESSVLVLDDIHWSPEMEKAWYELRSHPLVYGSIDLYRCGILFFEPMLNKQHFVWGIG